MSDTLLGVVIGGFIASLTPIVTLSIEYKKWKKDKKINFLELKRDQLEKAYTKASKDITSGMIERKFTIDTLSDFDFIFPKNVSDALNNFIKDQNKSQENMRSHNYIINKEMKKSLADISKEIENNIK